MAHFSSLIIGLGNPGQKYDGTRHNVGFRIIDEIASRYRCSPWKKGFKSLHTGLENAVLLKPQTFMNLSGEAAIEAVQFYKIPLNKVIVFHDDIDLQRGQVKMKQGGGPAGHNGLKSLDAHLGADYWRVRIGVGRPLNDLGEPLTNGDITDFVVSHFSKSDEAWLTPLIQACVVNFGLLQQENYTAYAKALPQTAKLV